MIYIIKENRTYDQVLGDLDRGNGDPSITEFGAAITPNQHKLASYFVDLDNFYDSGDVSANGWPWSTSGRESDLGTKSVPLNYSSSPTGGGRGTDYEYEGTNREINVGLPTLAQRLAADPATPLDPDILPGTGNVAAPDGPGTASVQQGYIWDAALAEGLSVRDYGMLCDLTRYSAPANTPLSIPEDRYPYQTGTQVSYCSNPTLQTRFDPYFRGFDNAFPDYYREVEWEREFAEYEKNGQLPSLELVRLMHDHTGNFSTAIDGVNTVELQQADNVPKFNRIVWEGLKGSVPYPSQRNGVDLRQNRKGTKEIADSRSLVANSYLLSGESLRPLTSDSLPIFPVAPVIRIMCPVLSLDR